MDSADEEKMKSGEPAEGSWHALGGERQGELLNKLKILWEGTADKPPMQELELVITQNVIHSAERKERLEADATLVGQIPQPMEGQLLEVLSLIEGEYKVNDLEKLVAVYLGGGASAPIQVQG